MNLFYKNTIPNHSKIRVLILEKFYIFGVKKTHMCYALGRIVDSKLCTFMFSMKLVNMMEGPIGTNIHTEIWGSWFEYYLIAGGG